MSPHPDLIGRDQVTVLLCCSRSKPSHACSCAQGRAATHTGVANAAHDFTGLHDRAGTGGRHSRA